MDSVHAALPLFRCSDFPDPITEAELTMHDNRISGTAGLYIHVPFCRTKCPYCHFASVTDPAMIPAYLEALQVEMDLWRGVFDPFDSVYIGGGTPSVLGGEELRRILSGLRSRFALASDSEITLEANPGDLTPESLETMRGLGVNRLNLGLQALDDAVLRSLGRRHSAAQAIRSVETAREAGYDNLGLDLMYAVPGQTLEGWLETLARAIEYSPEHLSCYELTFEEGTPFGRRFVEGEFPPDGEERRYEFFAATSERLEQAGYTHYEISNFARGPGHFSRHNQKYWDHTPYLGLGPSAHSFLGVERFWNVRGLTDYLSMLHRGQRPVGGREILRAEQLRLESLYFGFRTRKGLSLRDFEDRYETDLLRVKGNILEKMREEGLILLENGRLRPTLRGMALADSLCLL